MQRNSTNGGAPMTNKNKAIFHGALVAVGLAELFTTKNKLRALLIGACTGWHIIATCQHIRDMRSTNEKQQSIKRPRSR
jgi:hypothetical protein